MKKVFIYELIDPVTNETRYIGKTDNLKRRYKGHLNDKNKTHKTNWIKNLKNKDLKPVLNIIDEINKNEADFWEIFYISLYKSWGCKLTNTTSGGEGGGSHKGYKHTQRSKQQISQTKTGVSIWTEDEKKQISERLKGHITSEETKIKIKKSNIGKKRSQETKDKMSLAKLGKPSVRKGKKMSQETKDKMSLAAKKYIEENKEEFLKRYKK
jgi:hypothetical protein